jgi:apolipoprotein N-acyltransferase
MTQDKGPSSILLILGGVATALAFPLQPDPTRAGFALWPLAWISLTPLLAALRRTETVAAAGRAAFTFAVPWFFISCVWIFRVFDVYGWVLIWLPIGWVVLFGVLAHSMRRAGLSPWWSWPILWIAVEFIRSEWSPIRLDWFSPTLDPLRFSWLVLGHSRVSVPLLAQTADIWGGYGLSLAPFLCNLWLADVMVNRRLPVRALLILAGLTGIEVGYGFWSLARETMNQDLRVAVVQSERELLPALQELTEKLLAEMPDVRIVVWPEESFSEKLGDLAILQAFAGQHNLYLVVGAEHPVENQPHVNCAYVIPPSGEVGTYCKRERVPFVERHIPDAALPTFPLTIDERSVRAGVLICYDADFPTTARELTRAGAEILLMPTLDEGGWGGTQHVEHSLLPRLRAIENRRAVVQAATSGVSQIIDDRGRVLADVPYRLNRRPERATLFHEGAVSATVSPNAAMSVYSQFGYWFGPGMVVAAGFTVIAAMVRRSPPKTSACG